MGLMFDVRSLVRFCTEREILTMLVESDFFELVLALFYTNGDVSSDLSVTFLSCASCRFFLFLPFYLVIC